MKIVITNKIVEHDTHPYKTTISRETKTGGRVHAHFFGDVSQWRAFVTGMLAMSEMCGVKTTLRGINVLNDTVPKDE